MQKVEMMENNVENMEASTKETVPDEVKCFNWGAFFLVWVWGLFNKTFITLLYLICIFIPASMFFAFCFQLWFGFKGNEWAWKNKKWKSIEHFHKIQRKWAIAGLIFFAIQLLFSISIIMHSMYAPAKIINDSYEPTKAQKIILKSVEERVEKYKKEFDKYEFSENENKFYIDSEKWKTYTIKRKKQIFEMALEITINEKTYKEEQPEERIKKFNYDMFFEVATQREIKKTAIYSSQDNAMLMKFVEKDNIANYVIK